MDDFHVVIPSNVRNVSGELNTISSFRTYLPKSLTLDRNEWRVALVQIDFPFTWTNVSGDVAKIHLRTRDFRTYGQLPSRFYEEGSELIHEINGLLEHYKLKTRLIELPGKLCKLQVARHEKIGLHPTLAAILGYTDNSFNNLLGDKRYINYTSRYLMDTKASFYNLFVYTDLVSETLVGDAYVPLLQTVPIQNHQSGELIHKDFLLPQYMKLQTGTISSIHVQLCDESGNLVKFTNGHVIVKLHFKRFQNGTR